MQLHNFERQIDKLKTANEIIEDVITKRLQKLEQWNLTVAEEERYVYSEDEDPDSMEDLRELEAYVSEQFIEVSEELPQIMRSSLFVAAWSLLERELILLCEHYHHQSQSISPNELRHEGVTRSHVYLKQIIGIQFPDNTNTWQNIRSYNTIRNFIVHRGGKLDNSQRAEAVEDFCNRNTSFEITLEQRIRLKSNFNTLVLQDLGKFLVDPSSCLP